MINKFPLNLTKAVDKFQKYMRSFYSEEAPELRRALIELLTSGDEAEYQIGKFIAANIGIDMITAIRELSSSAEKGSKEHTVLLLVRLTLKDDSAFQEIVNLLDESIYDDYTTARLIAVLGRSSEEEFYKRGAPFIMNLLQRNIPQGELNRIICLMQFEQRHLNIDLILELIKECMKLSANNRKLERIYDSLLRKAQPELFAEMTEKYIRQLEIAI